MKRKMFFKLSAICMVAVSMLISCTKDYGSDIEALQTKVSELTTKVDALQQAIDGGAVITGVTAVTDGIKVTLSDGKTYTITNGEKGEKGDKGDKGDKGEDGANGTNGTNGTNGKDGSVVTIGENGNWFIDGVDTGKASKGADGANGVAGNNGSYYVPCTDKESANYGYWVLVSGKDNSETVTEYQWLPEGTITAVWDEEEECITFHNVEAAEDGIVEISLTTELKSLAVLPTTWSAYMGLPEVEVYTIFPKYMGNWYGNISFEECYPGMKQWKRTGKNEGYYTDYGTASGKYSTNTSTLAQLPPGFLANVLLSTYCGLYGETSELYNAYFDLTKSNLVGILDHVNANSYTIGADGEGSYSWWTNNLDFDNADYLEGAKDYLDMLVSFFSAANSTDDSAYAWANCEPITTDFNVSYRINPTNANLDGYKFSTVDRSVEVDESTPTKATGDSKTSMVKNVKATATKDGQLNVTGHINSFGYLAADPLTWLEAMVTLSFDWVVTGGDGIYTLLKNEYPKFTEYFNKIQYNTSALVALKATARDKSEMVSDYVYIKNNVLNPVFKAYDMTQPSLAPGNWANAKVSSERWWAFTNDNMKYTEEYHVAEHMRFADASYGDVTELFGDQLDYVYMLYNDGGEDEFLNSNYVDIDNTTGVVKIKEAYQQPDQLDKILGKTIVVRAYAYFGGNMTRLHDTEGAFYNIVVVPDMDESVNVVYDLGDVNYSELTKEFAAPRQALLDSLDMNADAFNKFYKDATSTALPTGYTATCDKTSENLISGTLDNTTLLGANQVVYTFAAADGYTSIKPATYTIKWNLVNDFPSIVLNPDYILYTDADRTVLDVSDAWDDVDTIIVVKGKTNPANTAQWIPQSSIKEHLKNYDAYADVNNFTNLSMKLTEARNGATPSAQIIATEETPYDLQEIVLKGGYTDFVNGYKDFVVSAYVDLANGQEELVKEYVVRFVCPFVVKCSDVILQTHTKDYCEAAAYVEVVEYGTNTVLVTYTAKNSSNGVKAYTIVVTNYAKTTYPNIFVASKLLPDYKLYADKSFNAYPQWGDNLYGGNNTDVQGAKSFGPWFYWNNDGTDLQADKTCYYTTTVTLAGDYGTVTGKGNVKVLSTANSTSTHAGDTGHTDNYLNTNFKPENLGDLPGSASGTYEVKFE